MDALSDSLSDSAAFNLSLRAAQPEASLRAGVRRVGAQLGNCRGKKLGVSLANY